METPEENAPLIGLDFETNGYCRWCPTVAVEVGIVEIRPEGEARVRLSSILSGAQWISPEAYRTHGIGLRETKGKPTLGALGPMLHALAGRAVCVHGKGTERKILKSILGQEPRWLDSLTLSRRHLKACPNHKLETVARYLGLEKELCRLLPEGKWHRAAFDAAASALIVREIQKIAGPLLTGTPGQKA